MIGTNGNYFEYALAGDAVGTKHIPFCTTDTIASGDVFFVNSR